MPKKNIFTHNIKRMIKLGIHGEHSESVDPVFDISNRYRLGHSEVELVEMMAQGVNKLIEMELSS